MENFVVITMLFFAVMAITAVVFIGWVVLRIFGFILRAIFGSPRPTLSMSSNHIRCPRDKCLADNPANANFCRRCGVRLKPGQSSLPRQAALW